MDVGDKDELHAFLIKIPRPDLGNVVGLYIQVFRYDIFDISL